MAILGSHMSIAGGVSKAVERAHAAGCDCVQIFTAAPQQWPKTTPPAPAGPKPQRGAQPLTKNNNQWRAKEITEAEALRFRESLATLGITHPISHDSYLINMASPDPELWRKSIDAFVVELQRVEQLGIPYVVAHPGAFTTSSEEAGLKRIAAALDEVHGQLPDCPSKCLLETTAGQGSNLGAKFDHLAAIINLVKDPDRVGVCVDTCHIFAAGYPLDTEKNYTATMKELDLVVGIDRVKAFHLNDSLKDLGSHVDRHAHIGRGKMGVEPFRNLLNDSRFANVPMYLETAKGEEDGEDLDVINLRTLRGLIAE